MGTSCAGTSLPAKSQDTYTEMIAAVLDGMKPRRPPCHRDRDCWRAGGCPSCQEVKWTRQNF
jgi:hypothetical protein